ncbi:MAG TPA: hypothetical protein VFJ48_11560 [Casimicrobiaceae bacterium]|nr:hypothetical protein [Casimicrobiaceae bacterium]
MQKLLALPLLIIAAVPAFAADVAVSVTVGDPRFYGRIDVLGYPQPQLVYPEPVVVQPAPTGVVVQPVYVRVPPGHAKDWKKHCKKYKLCGQPVYFVQDTWYTQVYVPEYRVKKGKDKPKKVKEQKD